MKKLTVKIFKQIAIYGLIISIGIFTGCGVDTFNNYLNSKNGNQNPNNADNQSISNLSGEWVYSHYEERQYSSMVDDVSVHFKLKIDSMDGRTLNGSYEYKFKYSDKDFLKRDSGKIYVQQDYINYYEKANGTTAEFDYYIYLGDSDYGGSNALVGFNKDGSVYLRHDWMMGESYKPVPKIK